MARHKHTAALQLQRVEPRAKSSLHITPRQREILRLVALGHTNREIAGSLDISVRTVEVHRFNLMRRLNVRNVAQLLRQALQHNLLPRNFGNK
ncbi:MAG TPA: LuxR C-terminal-related transcriptional regulator [Nitrospira sp.]|jgi:two-component system secretion response regulator SsrB|nr:LuxR C-terminal-related transcriptional regulator [Nitrospira sp.]